MTDKFDDGGPMHPGGDDFDYGSSLWDYYAGQALAACVPSEGYDTTHAAYPAAVARLVKNAAGFADAMIAEKRRREDE